MNKSLSRIASISLTLLTLHLESGAYAETPAKGGIQHLQGQQNLARGGSFESQDLEGFKTEVLSGKADVALTSARAHSGKKSLQIKGDQASVELTQTIAVEPDTVYEISFWIDTEDLVGRGVTGLRVSSDQYGLLPYICQSLGFNDGKWHEFKVFTHSGPASKLTLSLTFGLWEKATGTVCYDDLSVRAIARSKGAYPLAVDRPLPPGVTMSREAKVPYNEPFETMAGYPTDKFQPTIESLRQYECPEWFRDAKFGIYLHWGPYSVAEQECWFPRLMYVEGFGEHEWFKNKFGDVSKFGYKDIIPLWKGENFDPDRLVQLFKRAGARYITPVAVHHDNFDLWDSQYHRWNSVKMGPKKDITAMWRDAVLRHGLRFGVTTHLAWSYSWWGGVNKGADLNGPQAGVPYDGNNPEYSDLYHLPNGERGFYPINPTARWRFEWALRTMDLIDKFQPDLLYFDGAIPFNGVDQAKTGMEVIAYYYNRSMQWHDGRLEGVMTIKRGADGLYDEHAATLDLERSTSSEIRQASWQTDDSIGPWAYKPTDKYKSVDEIVDQLVDIVSKNGNLLLNVPPRADGTLDEETEAILNGIGEWMDVNGEAIYATRPWRIAEEETVRFTKKGDILYVTSLDKPSDKLIIKALSQEAQKQQINSVSLLGYDKEIQWSQNPQQLEIGVPADLAGEHAWVFKIHLVDAVE